MAKEDLASAVRAAAGRTSDADSDAANGATSTPDERQRVGDNGKTHIRKPSLTDSLKSEGRWGVIAKTVAAARTKEDLAFAARSGGRFLNDDFYHEAAEGFNEYDPESWMETLDITGSEFMMPVLMATVGLTFVFTVYALYIADDPKAKALFDIDIDAHVVLGGALSFLIVFRTDASMNRWWEARKVWDEATGTCREMAAQTIPAMPSTRVQESMFMQLM